MLKRISVLLISYLLVVATLSFAETKVYFSPKGGCQDAILSQIGKVQETIDVAMYAFTSREISQEIINLKGRNIKVRVVLDKDQATQKYSKGRYLADNGINVRYHRGTGLMHNKYAVIDGKTLITGSFNWTPTADQKNEENLLIITDPEIVKKYAQRFEYLWQKAR